MVPLVKGLAA